MANRSDNTQARDSSLIPPLDQDLPNVVLDDDDVHTVDLSPDVLGFVATLLLVRADGGPFQWGSDPEQGAGPWWDAGSVVSVPCGGATSMKFIRRNNGGDTVTLSIKALGSY